MENTDREREQSQVRYYMTMVAKFRLLQEIEEANKAGFEKIPAVIRVENERKLLELN